MSGNIITPDTFIGKDTDGHNVDTLGGRTKQLLEHVHKPSKVYPTLAVGVTVIGGAAWTLGAFVEIVPLNTITSDFDIHYVSIEAISANDVYELVLYSDADGVGGNEVEIGRVRFTRSAIQSATLNVPFMTPLISANAQIKAKIASSSGGGDSAVISVFYHTY
jgi:hypothetical protein